MPAVSDPKGILFADLVRRMLVQTSSYQGMMTVRKNSIVLQALGLFLSARGVRFCFTPRWDELLQAFVADTSNAREQSRRRQVLKTFTEFANIGAVRMNALARAMAIDQVAPYEDVVTGELGGFAEVDSSGDTASLTGELTAVSALPFTQLYMAAVRRLLKIAPGTKLLDVGAGIGSDIDEVLSVIGGGGSVALVDTSQVMTHRLRTSFGARPNVRIEKADGHALPFSDGEFDAVRVVRMLMYAKTPMRVLEEMARVTVSGGRVLALEPNWSSLDLSHPDAHLTPLILHHYANFCRNPRIGMELPGLFMALPVTDLSVETFTRTCRSLHEAEQLYNFRDTLTGAMELGVVSPQEASSWWSELLRLEREQRFFLTLTLVGVCGTKR